MESPQFKRRFISGGRAEYIERVVEENWYHDILDQSDHIILAFGTNNIWNTKPYQIKNLLLYGAELMQTKYVTAKIYLATIPRRWDREIRDKKVGETNLLIRKSVHKYNIGLFDIAKTFEIEGKKKPRSVYWGRDGLHLNWRGARD